MTWLGSRPVRWLSALAAVTCWFAVGAGRAEAQVACDSLPNVVYMQIGDTQQPLIKELGRALRDNTPNPISIVYVTSGSCTNIAAIYNDTAIATNLLYVPSTAEHATWTPALPAPPFRPPTGSDARCGPRGTPAVRRSTAPAPAWPPPRRR